MIKPLSVNRFASPLTLLFLTLFAVRPSMADVKVPSIFGDHMVLQQDASLPVWGDADAGEKVTVTVGADTDSAMAGSDGKWRVTLKPLGATSTPLTMTVAGKNTLTFSDVLVGEVWIGAGQSNMGLSLGQSRDAATDIPQANDPQLRFFHASGPQGLVPSNSFTIGKWVLTTPMTAPGYSAVAYYFGKGLRTKLNRPVAIIQNAVGGTVAESWTPLDALKSNPALQSYVDTYNEALAAFPGLNADYQARFDAWHKTRIDWENEVGKTYDPLVKAWKAEAAKDQDAGQKPPPQPQPSRPAPPPPLQPWGGQNKPTVLYNANVAPVIPYAIRGVIWYQGESNAGDWSKYHTLLATMITGWRDHWGQGNFPFIIVQLPRYSGGGYWPQIREAQAQTLSLPDTAMATTIDVGDPNNLHPVDKSDVGQRLSLVARHMVYGEKDLVWTGPIYNSMTVQGSTIRLRFTQTGSGLVIGSSPWVPPHSEAIPTTSLLGFTIADNQKHWFPADAKIEGDTVVLSSDKVTTPTAVRYAWEKSPVCNLYNKEGLPAAPFRTDDWPD